MVPIGPRVFVQYLPDEEKKIGSFIIPTKPEDQKRVSRGRVLRIGDAPLWKYNGDLDGRDVQAGDTIYFHKAAAVEFDAEHFVVDLISILGRDERG